jgi:hypothetical protein
MKLDSEEQRKDLLEMLPTVRVSCTLGELKGQLAEFHRIIKPIIEAEIEPPQKIVVPIEFLAPDTPEQIRRYVGMPGFEKANVGEPSNGR